MRTQPPSYFSEHLSNDRLTIIAEQLLNTRYDTIELLNSALDDNYVKETATYGRQRNMIIQLCLSKQYEWLSLLSSGMDVTFAIGNIPCRFFTDDPLEPHKDGFFKKNATDDLFATDDQVPVTWRFIVSKSVGDSDSKVYFIGYNYFNESICEWMYSDDGRSLYSIDTNVPSAVEIKPARVEIRGPEIEHKVEGAEDGTRP